MKGAIEHVYQLLMNRRTPISVEALAREVEVSERSVKRYISDLRLYWDLPIVSKRGRGYLLEDRDASTQIPGHYFSSEALEIFLLLILILERMAPKTLGPITEPLLAKIQMNLSRLNQERSFPVERIRVLITHQRKTDPDILHQVTQLLTDNSRANIEYRARSSEQNTHRLASIQRLVYYRDHWYIDVLDHDSGELRTLALDRVQQINATNDPSELLDNKTLDLHYRDSYGIFAGPKSNTAVLRFNASIAPWASEEVWHRNQETIHNADGSCVLKVPYSLSTELVGEILRWGGLVEVLEPPSLRAQVVAELDRARALYGDE